MVYARFRDRERCLLELHSQATDAVLETVRRHVDLLGDAASELHRAPPAEVRPPSRELLIAAVGGINELRLARVERGEADRLAEDAEVAATVLIGLPERR